MSDMPARKLGDKYLEPTSACMRNFELVMKMCDDGASLRAIGKAVGTQGKNVRRFLKIQGITRDFPLNRKGERSPQWKGGRHIDKDGYVNVYCPNHPNARKHTPYILEHRLVMEAMIGRYLLPEEVVHHRDKNKQNNHTNNLQLFSENAEHLRHELTGSCPKWTEDGKRRILEAVVRPRKQYPRNRRKPSEHDALPLR